MKMQKPERDKPKRIINSINPTSSSTPLLSSITVTTTMTPNSHLALRRARPFIRPLRPPNPPPTKPLPRPFTQNAQLLLISPASPRPQLPFLASPSRRLPIQRTGQWQLARLLTTERKRYIRDQFVLAGKYTLYLWAFGGLAFLVAVGYQHERLERLHPSPPEWGFLTRMQWRSARAQENPDFNGTGLVDWASTGEAYRRVLRRLEDANVDGKGLREQEEGGILVPGVGKAGYDITSKSDAWRRGYFDVLMGCARAAEHLDGWVKDDTRNVAFPADVVIGPSNPNPRPVPPGAKDPPLEENCSPAFEPPEHYYMKVLTSKGFTTRQRLDAALAYADWLDFKGLSESAEEMYRWGLDIASAALPNPNAIVDGSTGVIKEDAPTVSPNLLHAATALAVHHARRQNVDAALPIFLSVLRARRAAPTSPFSSASSASSASSSSSSTTNADTNPLRTAASTLVSIFAPPRYPAAPPSGDDPLIATPAQRCDEAALMAYIGEILFSSSPTPSARETGLSWTRRAVDEAEAGAKDGRLAREEREKCVQCVDVGLGNWGKMVRRLVREEKGREGALVGGQGEDAGSGWLRFWSSGQRPEEVKVDRQGEESRWEREEREVEARTERFRREGLREKFAMAGGQTAGGTWLG